MFLTHFGCFFEYSREVLVDKNSSEGSGLRRSRRQMLVTSGLKNVHDMMYIILFIILFGLIAVALHGLRHYKPLDLIRSDKLESLAKRNDKNIAILLDYHEKYMKNFLAKSHEQLGRKGAVCPFIPISLKKSTIYYKVMDTTNFDEAEATILKYKDIFLTLDPTSEQDAVYKTIIFVFTKLRDNEAGPFIENLQKKLKPAMVKKGLMIGDFHPLSKLPGNYFHQSG